MGQRQVCTFRHTQRVAYRTAISAAQILVNFDFIFANGYWAVAVMLLIIGFWVLHSERKSLNVSKNKLLAGGRHGMSPPLSSLCGRRSA